MERYGMGALTGGGLEEGLYLRGNTTGSLNFSPAAR